MKKRIRLLFSIGLLALSCQSWLGAQVYFPADGVLYGDLEIPRIDITIAQADLDDLYLHPDSEEEKPVSFSFTGNGVSESLDEVGIRCKGNTSLGNQKKSFKLSFNTFVAGRKFYGVEKLNISAEVNDPSMIRANLCWKLYRRLGIPGPRSNHIRLYINGSFYGIYHNVEQIDENLMKSRLGAGYGNLYKCLWPADMAYLGSDPDAYKYYSGDRQPYDLQVNEEYDDYRDLAAMITALNTLDGSTFRDNFERYFNVQMLLKIMALDVMTGNWDDYIFNQNNYYVYRDPLTGRFEIFPYDMDNTFGVDWVGQDWGNRSVYNWGQGTRPLYTKILSFTDYREQYTAALQEIGELMESDWFSGEAERIRALIRTYLPDDTYYPRDYGYTLTDFENTLTQSWGWQVKYGILPYISTRVASMKSETGTVDAPPLITYFRAEIRHDSCIVIVSAEDDRDPVSLLLHYRIGDGAIQERDIPEATDLSDAFSGRKQFRVVISDIIAPAEVELYVTANAGSATSLYPAEALKLAVPAWSGPLLINEFLASNQSSSRDSYGEYDDWVEVYNNGTADLELSDYFLSDEYDNPDKYRFAQGIIKPGAFRMVWLDGQPEQGDNHAVFKLNKGGEALRLSGLPSAGFRISDYLEFSAQATDVSSGRFPDGSDTWQLYTSPTPGYSNLLTSAGDEFREEAFSIFPNPVYDGVVYFNRIVTVRIYNMTGQIVGSAAQTDRMSVEHLSPGIYLLRTEKGEAVQMIVR